MAKFQMGTFPYRVAIIENNAPGATHLYSVKIDDVRVHDYRGKFEPVITNVANCLVDSIDAVDDLLHVFCDTWFHTNTFDDAIGKIIDDYRFDKLLDARQEWEKKYQCEYGRYPDEDDSYEY